MGIVGTEDSLVEHPERATVIWRLLLGACQLVGVFCTQQKNSDHCDEIIMRHTASLVARDLCILGLIVLNYQ
jgi:hypothetical protein